MNKGVERSRGTSFPFTKRLWGCTVLAERELSIEETLADFTVGQLGIKEHDLTFSSDLQRSLLSSPQCPRGPALSMASFVEASFMFHVSRIALQVKERGRS